jgi:hypothetical protein
MTTKATFTHQPLNSTTNVANIFNLVYKSGAEIP